MCKRDVLEASIGEKKNEIKGNRGNMKKILIKQMGFVPEVVKLRSTTPSISSFGSIIFGEVVLILGCSIIYGEAVLILGSCYPKSYFRHLR